jgi:RHS repeat-associated protein
MKGILFRTAAACVLLLTAWMAAADALETMPPGMGKYVMVLRHPRPVAPGQTPEKIAEPDVAAHGGRVIESWDNFRVLYLPPAAAKQVRGHKSVDHLQRVWMGEPLDQWDETEVAGTPDFDAASHSEPDPSWDSGDYAYDGSGNIKSIGADLYTYDSVGRIKTAVVNGVTQTFEYDAFGNLTKLQTGSALAPIRVDSTTNRLANESYDVAGNMTSRAGDQYYSGSTFLYDSVGMMVWRAGKTGYRRMIYTADDERIGTYHSATAARWKIRGFDDNVLREFVSYNDVWYWVEDYLYAGGQLVGAEVPSAQNTPYDLRKRHFHTDHLGSVRLITASSNRISIGRHDYFPFGLEQTLYYQEQENFGGQNLIRPEPMRFTSHERDYLGHWNAYDEEQLDYMHARHYDPRTGRFLSVDPAMDIQSALHNPQTWNRYSYARNNPIGYVDPDGRAAQAAVGIVAQGAAIGALEGAAIQMAFNYILDQPLMQDVGREALVGAGIGAVTAGAGVLLKGAYDGFRITRAVRMALNSADNAVRLEGQAAAALGRSVTDFQKVVKAGGKTVGEIDIETSKAIVEVTGGRSPGKLQQVLNLINDKTLNPAGKQVVVYAPNLGKHATKTLQDAGAIVVRTTDELRKVAR